MPADDVQLDLVNRLQLRGRSEVGEYFHWYAAAGTGTSQPESLTGVRRFSSSTQPNRRDRRRSSSCSNGRTRRSYRFAISCSRATSWTAQTSAPSPPRGGTVRELAGSFGHRRLGVNVTRIAPEKGPSRPSSRRIIETPKLAWKSKFRKDCVCFLDRSPAPAWQPAIFTVPAFCKLPCLLHGKQTTGTGPDRRWVRLIPAEVGSPYPRADTTGKPR